MADGALVVAAVNADTPAAGDSRRLAAIRDVLARFDWEHDDRQFALEEIERIAEGSDHD